MAVDSKQVKELRELTNAGMMECKAALEESGGNFDKAQEVLRRKGIALADKKAGKETKEGRIGSYVHSTGKIACLVELTCETDFVAKTPEFEDLLKDLCLQVAGFAPVAVGKDDLPKELVEAEKVRFADEVKGKPPQIVEKILEGKLEKNLYAQKCLLHMPFCKEEKFKGTVGDLIKSRIAKFGENLTVRRFVRYELGG